MAPSDRLVKLEQTQVCAKREGNCNAHSSDTYGVRTTFDTKPAVGRRVQLQQHDIRGWERYISFLVFLVFLLLLVFVSPFPYCLASTMAGKAGGFVLVPRYLSVELVVFQSNFSLLELVQVAAVEVGRDHKLELV